MTQVRKPATFEPRGSFEDYMKGAEERAKKTQYESIVKGRPNFAKVVPFEEFAREYEARREGIEMGGGQVSDVAQDIFLDLLNAAL
jgi:hypothetical protein